MVYKVLRHLALSVLQNLVHHLRLILDIMIPEWSGDPTYIHPVALLGAYAA